MLTTPLNTWNLPLLVIIQVLTASSVKITRLLGCCTVLFRRSLSTFQRSSTADARSNNVCNVSKRLPDNRAQHSWRKSSPSSSYYSSYHSCSDKSLEHQPYLIWRWRPMDHSGRSEGDSLSCHKKKIDWKIVRAKTFLVCMPNNHKNYITFCRSFLLPVATRSIVSIYHVRHRLETCEKWRAWCSRRRQKGETRRERNQISASGCPYRTRRRLILQLAFTSARSIHLMHCNDPKGA